MSLYQPVILASLAGSYALWFVAQLIALAIIVLLIVRWRPGFLGKRTIGETLGAALDARSAQIQSQLEAAERSRREAEEIRAQSRRDVERAREEARVIVDRAQETSVAIQREMHERAQQEYERIVGQARGEIEYERRQAELALQKEAASVVVDAATEVVRNALTPEGDRRLIVESLANLTDLRDLP